VVLIDLGKMAEQLADAFQGIAQQITGLTTVFGVQGVAQNVKRFGGNPREHKDRNDALSKGRNSF
jgi:hypothetical protein